MLTTMLVVAVALSGTADDVPLDPARQPLVLAGKAFRMSPDDRDPFVSPYDHEIRRLNYLLEKFRDAGLEETFVESLLTDSRLSRKLQLPPLPEGAPPPETGWPATIRNLLGDELIAHGKEFREEHSGVLEQPERIVPSEVMTALIGLESVFGKDTGSYITWNAYYRRLLRQPRGSLETKRERRAWRSAARNLVAQAVYCNSHKLDCYTLIGSFAGAVGLVQFLFENIAPYGVDGNNDGRVDLGNIEDAVPSADKLLKANGWRESPQDALSRYYSGHPYAESTEGRNYADAVLMYSEAIREPLEALDTIRARAEDRFSPKKGAAASAQNVPRTSTE